MLKTSDQLFPEPGTKYDEADIFGCEMQETCITVTADQNLVEEELHGTITLMTLPSQIHFATIQSPKTHTAHLKSLSGRPSGIHNPQRGGI